MDDEKVKLNRSLVQACIDGDEVEAQKFIDAGADIHYAEYAPFFEACRRNHLHIAKLIVKRWFELKEKQNYFTAITCQYNNLEMLNLLVEMKLNIHDYHYCALRVACNQKNIDLIDYLLNHSNPNDLPKLHKMVIDNTIKDKKEEMVKHLIMHHDYLITSKVRKELWKTDFFNWYNSYLDILKLNEKLSDELRKGSKVAIRKKI